MVVNRRHAFRLATTLLCLLLPAGARGLDLQGSARVYGGRTDTENGDLLEQDILNQKVAADRSRLRFARR